jgi:outer membrane protein OmpA-like peptidoglycan-associated protein
MAASIMETLMQSLGPAVTARAASIYGESEPAVRKGLTAAIAAVLAAMAARATETNFTRDLTARLKDAPADVGLLDEPEKAFSRPVPVPGETGPFARLQPLLFGDSTRHITDAIANAAGLKPATAASLFTLAVPTVVGYLSRLIKRENLDPASLGRRLTDERAALPNALPASLAGLLGGSDVFDDAARAAVPVASRSSSGTWVALALGGLAALIALWALVGRSARSPADGTAGAIGTAGYLSRTLPDGTTLRFPPASTESQLLAALESNAPVDRDAWYEFDRVTFETDSATLRAQSREQLSNIAAILKAFPPVRVKMGGYTDNSGDPAANQRLSQARAESVMNELRTMGVDGTRLEAEGYGDQHPVADNGTAEGRAKNRRVALRVTSR